MALSIPGLTIHWAARHHNKLRLGHLAANRFAIKIRNVAPTDVVKLRPILTVLEKRGMPNYFGEQRFGRRGDNAHLGAALIRGDDADLLHHLLGNPNPSVDDPDELTAREAFDRGDYESALNQFPRRAAMERRILNRLARTKNPTAAVRAVEERCAACGSPRYNPRSSTTFWPAGSPPSTASWTATSPPRKTAPCFPVESAATEQPRCDAFEISPTGPLVGYRMPFPQGQPLAIEQSALAAVHLTPEDFRVPGRHKIKGARRPLRVRPKDTSLEGGVDEHGPYITVAFTLPPGSYATVLLRELTKSDADSPEHNSPNPS